MTDDKPLETSDYIEAHELIGDVEGWWHCDVDSEDASRVYLIWTEGLEFHVKNRCPVLMVEDQVHPRAAEILQAELRRLLGRQSVDASVSDQDDPAMEVGVTLLVQPATYKRLSDLAWPIVATLTNVMDPGTFNAEYVMGTVARNIEKEQEA